MSDLGNKAVMAKNIRYYMALHDKTRAEMSRDLNIKYTTLTDWINGNTYPRIDKIEIMARYFGIEKSDLVESKAVASQKISVSADEADLLAIYSKLNASGREKAIDYLSDLAGMEKYTEKEKNLPRIRVIRGGKAYKKDPFTGRALSVQFRKRT